MALRGIKHREAAGYGRIIQRSAAAAPRRAARIWDSIQYQSWGPGEKSAPLPLKLPAKRAVFPPASDLADVEKRRISVMQPYSYTPGSKESCAGMVVCVVGGKEKAAQML
jgi:hypothetical protein